MCLGYRSYICNNPCQYNNYISSPPSLKVTSAYKYMSSPKHVTGRKDEWYTTREISPKVWYSTWKQTRQQWRNQKTQYRYINIHYSCVCIKCKLVTRSKYKKLPPPPLIIDII